MEKILSDIGGIVAITFLVGVSRFIVGDNFSFVILIITIFQLAKSLLYQRRV